MNTRVAIVVLGASALVPGLALAQDPAPQGERPWAAQPLPAPTNALEIGVGTGYTQGFGNLQSNVSMPNVASAGVGIDLSVGYRADPRWSVSLDGQYFELDAQRFNSARGVAGTAAVTYHFNPSQKLDPWMQLGAGYRALWENAANDASVVTHGLQLARGRVGLDFRVAPEVALGPVIGADANLFLFQDVNGPLVSVDTSIDNPRLNTFVFAGLQGRFDVGSTQPSYGAVARR